MGKISVASLGIDMPTREPLAGETKNSFAKRFQNLENKNNVCKQISSLLKKIDLLDAPDRQIQRADVEVQQN